MSFLLTRDATFGFQLSVDRTGRGDWMPAIWCGSREVAVAVLASIRGE